uniref:Uncharacterized protein n=1 Tax=Arundo donax TaxID=35708 RepID=A0A0A8Z8C3_ARUDO
MTPSTVLIMLLFFME